MKILTNQTLYQCDFCGKRLLSKQGAALHEKQYCTHSQRVSDRGYKLISNCDHIWVMEYGPMPGEPHLKEPYGEYCVKCHADMIEIYKNGELKPKEEISKSTLRCAAKYYSYDPGIELPF